jgi:hypothetical protein
MFATRNHPRPHGLATGDIGRLSRRQQLATAGHDAKKPLWTSL